MGIIDEALAKGQRALSEYQAKLFLKERNIPVTREELVMGEEEAVAARSWILLSPQLPSISFSFKHVFFKSFESPLYLFKILWWW